MLELLLKNNNKAVISNLDKETKSSLDDFEEVKKLTSEEVF